MRRTQAVSTFLGLQLAVWAATHTTGMGLVLEPGTEQFRWETPKKEIQAVSWRNSAIIPSYSCL